MVFNISLTELFVVVTGAGLLLGRREIIVGARAVGSVVGRVVGSLQGVKYKFEKSS